MRVCIEKILPLFGGEGAPGTIVSYMIAPILAVSQIAACTANVVICASVRYNRFGFIVSPVKEADDVGIVCGLTIVLVRIEVPDSCIYRITEITVGEVNLFGVAYAEGSADLLRKCRELAIVDSYAYALLVVAGYSFACGGVCGNGGVFAVVESELNIGTAG